MHMIHGEAPLYSLRISKIASSFKACLLLGSLCLAQAFAWDGYDYGSNSYVEINKGNTVRPGRSIEIYDYGTGQYKDVEVESVRRYGSRVEVEVYDDGESRTLEMDD